MDSRFKTALLATLLGCLIYTRPTIGLPSRLSGETKQAQATTEPLQSIELESIQESVENLTKEHIENPKDGKVEAYFQIGFNEDKDEFQLTTPVGLTLAVLFAIITGVGLIANGIVFFVIIAGNEIGKLKGAMRVYAFSILIWRNFQALKL